MPYGGTGVTRTHRNVGDVCYPRQNYAVVKERKEKRRKKGRRNRRQLTGVVSEQQRVRAPVLVCRRAAVVHIPHPHTYTHQHIAIGTKHTRTYIHIHIHTHTHTYTYTYIHIHTPLVYQRTKHGPSLLASLVGSGYGLPRNFISFSSFPLPAPFSRHKPILPLYQPWRNVTCHLTVDLPISPQPQFSNCNTAGLPTTKLHIFFGPV